MDFERLAQLVGSLIPISEARGSSLALSTTQKSLSYYICVRVCESALVTQCLCWSVCVLVCKRALVYVRVCECVSELVYLYVRLLVCVCVCVCVLHLSYFISHLHVVISMPI